MTEKTITKKDVKAVLETFEDVSKYIDSTLFKVIFPKHVAKHLTRKWIQYDKNLLDLWVTLDNTNRSILSEFIKDQIQE